MTTPSDIAHRIKPRPPSIRCGVKKQFLTLEEAAAELRRIRLEKDRLPVYPKSAYFCEFHGAWHLTHHESGYW